MDSLSLTDFFTVIFLVLLFYPLVCALIALVVSIFKKNHQKSSIQNNFQGNLLGRFSRIVQSTQLLLTQKPPYRFREWSINQVSEKKGSI